MAASPPDVTVCIPAYEAADFVENVLRCVQQQTHAGLRVNVSVDKSSDGTAEVCRRFARTDRRFQVFEQAERLGWIGNVNFLLDRVDTELFFIMPHDDTIEARYVERLRQELSAAPQAVLAFSARPAAPRGVRPGAWAALQGGMAERLLALLTSDNPGLPWQGLTRAAVLRGGRRMRTPYDGFGAHVLWVLELLCLGPFAHLPQPLYVKGPPRRGVTLGWAAWPPERQMAAAVEHVAACLGLVDAALDEGQSRLPFILACAIRVLGQARQTRGQVRVEPPSRYDDMVLLSGLMARAFAGTTFGEAEAAALRAAPGPRHLMASLLRRDGRRLRASGYKASAVESDREAAALDPLREAAQDRQADAIDQQEREGRVREALNAAERALARSDGTDAMALLEIASLHLKARQLALARQRLEQALSLDPGEARSHHLLAVLLGKEGRLAEARNAAQRALDLDPGSARTRRLLEQLVRRETRQQTGGGDPTPPP